MPIYPANVRYAGRVTRRRLEMKKLILASVSGIALMGLAACNDTDGTTTQSVPSEQEAPMAQPEPTTPPTAPVD